jgi:hypothetical protein
VELASRLTVIAFGLWLICVSIFIFARPELALKGLRRFASTNLINYTELTLRLIAGLGLMGLAQYTDYTRLLQIGGGFLALTALILIPRKWHHVYALYWADKMKPWMVRFCAPFSLVLGGILIWLAV